MLIRKLFAVPIDVRRVVVDVKKLSRHGQSTTFEPTADSKRWLALDGNQIHRAIVNFFAEVSKTEQQRSFERSHATPITAQSRYLSVTESSVTLPPDPRRSTMFTRSPPLCPICATTAGPARITPGPSGFHVPTFECPACNDPIKSVKTNGWLHGQLQAPR
jgi:hypothetical protein